MNTSLRYLGRGSAEDTSSAWNLDRATGLRNIEHNRPQQQTRKKTTQNAIQLSQTGPLPCMPQLHLAYQSYKSLTKHSQSQGTFNLPQQGIDLPNPTVGGYHPFLGVRLTLNPNSTAGGWRHKLLVTPGQPCAGWGTTHTCPPKQNRRHPSLQSAQGQRPSPKSCALSSDSCKHTCTARISL